MAEKTRVLLVSGDHRVAANLSRSMWDADLVVDSVATVEGATVRMRDFAPHLVLAGEPDSAQDLCRQVRRASPSSRVLVVLPPEQSYPQRKAEELGADGFLLAPLTPGEVVTCARWAVQLKELARQITTLREELDERALAPPPGLPESAHGDFEFFKKALLLEVRRSKRYHFPLALLVVGIDRFDSTVGRMRVLDRGRLMRLLLQQVGEAIRDIDLAVSDGAERFLVCLPQTDMEGARYVAERIREQLRAASPRNSGPPITVSVGVSAFEGADDEIGFKRLLDEATVRLGNAQRQGGDMVESVPLPMR